MHKKTVDKVKSWTKTEIALKRDLKLETKYRGQTTSATLTTYIRKTDILMLKNRSEKHYQECQCSRFAGMLRKKD